MESHIIQCGLLSLFALTAIIVARATNLFSAAFLAGIGSLLVASMFFILDAPDVAFTEAAVGAGLSTILLLAAIAATDHRYAYYPMRHAVSLPLVCAVGWLIYYSMLDLPLLAAADAPAHNHVSAYYIENTPSQIGIPNMVTAILASYRGFDTLGEVSVIFTTGIGALIILSYNKDGNE